MISRVVKKEDYERYSVLLPVENLFGKRRKRFLYGELDKLHPCFSENCCFDSKVSVKNKSFCADVVVMEKLKLAEYRYKYPGKPLVAEECLKRTVFARLDYEKKLLLVVLTILIVSFWLCSFLVSLRKSRSQSYRENIEITKASVDYSVNVPESDKEISVSDLFQLIKTDSGICNQFEWNYDGYTEEIIMSVSSIFPEKLSARFSQIDIPQISYKENIPFYKIKVAQRNPNLASQVEMSVDFMDDIRKIVINKGGVLVSEDVHKRQICFSGTGNQIENILKDLCDLSGIRNRKISSLKVNSESNIKQMILQFGDTGRSEKDLLQIILSFWNPLFSRDKKPEVVKGINLGKSGEIKKVEVNTRDNIREKKNDSGNKIGKIVHGDGTEAVFYKNGQKKIIQIVGEQRE